MSTGTGATPLSVDDVLGTLLADAAARHARNDNDTAGQTSSEKVSTSSDDGASTSLLPPATELLPAPKELLTHHRVQVSLRGRRYEMTMEVAVTYCLTFYAFFHVPYTSAHGHVESSPTETMAPAALGCTVGDVAAERQEGTPARLAMLSESALMDHYTSRVEPLVQWYVNLPPPAATSVGTAAAAAFTPPALPRPQRIAYEPAGHLWKFEYPPRLTEAEEAQERLRRQQQQQQLSSSASAATGAATEPVHITSDEINASPFLLLQNDYMGMLLVYLRRSCKARGEHGASYPALPIRWHEISYDEQVSFLQLLRAFGVVPLMAAYGRPTAPLSTSQCVGSSAAAVAAAAAAEGEACSLRAKAEAFRRLQATQETAATPLEQRDRKSSNNDKDNDDDDGVVLQAKGCARCGMAGHSTDECPY